MRGPLGPVEDINAFAIDKLEELIALEKTRRDGQFSCTSDQHCKN